jgi:hypothetical protein
MQMRLTKPLAPISIGAVSSRPGTTCAYSAGKSHGQGNDEGVEGTGGGCGGGERGGVEGGRGCVCVGGWVGRKWHRATERCMPHTMLW